MKNLKKLISLALTVIMVAGCMAIPMTASAAITGLVEQDFSSLATSSDVKTSLTTLATLPWSINASTTSTYSSVDRGDANGTALKWDVAQSAYAWSVTNVVALPTVLVNEEPAGTQVWFSFDFEIPTVDGRFDLMLYPAQPSSNGANAIWIYDLPNSASKPSFGATTGGTAATAGTEDITGNGWHTIEVCQEKVNGENNIIDLTVYLDGVEVMTREDLKPHNWQPYSAAYLHAGYNYTASSISYDNFKNFKCQSGEHTPAVPEIPEEPEEPAPTEGVKTVMGEYLTASTWGSGTGYTFTDVDGSNGKAASDKVIRMEIAPNGSNKAIHHLTYLPSTEKPSAEKDILIEFDYRVCDYNWQHFMSYFNWGSANYFPSSENGALVGQTWWPYYVPTMVAPLNQWNHFTIRFTATPQAILYMNGVKIGAISTGAAGSPVNQWAWRHEYKGSAAAGSIPGGAIEFDNFTVSSYTAGTFCDEYCTTRNYVYRNYDFENINLNNSQYETTMGSGTSVKAAEGFTYGATTGASVADGKAGKVASDKNLSYASTAAGWKQFAFSQQALFEGSRATIEPGSTLRGGLSFLLDSDKPLSGSIRVQSVLNSSASASVMSQPAVFIGQQGEVVLREDTFTAFSDLSAVEGLKLIYDKWYRLDYVINVSDGEDGSVNTIDYYLDGKLLNAEPIEIVYDVPSAGAQPANNPIGSFTMQVIDDYTNSFNVDDITLEYIPAGSEIELDALNKVVALPGSADGSVVLSNGAIALMDAATSALTADGLNAKLCPNTPVSLVSASGAAVTSGLAAGNYAYLSRGVLPGIFYKVSDLDVAVDGKEVTATLPYAVDENVVMIVALYKSDDQFATCLSDTAADGQLEVTVSNDEATSYKVFLWKSKTSMMPFYAAAEGSLN